MIDKENLMDRLRISAKLARIVTLQPHEVGALVAHVQDLKEQIAVCKERETIAWQQADNMIRVSFRQRQQIIELQKFIPKDKHLLAIDSL